jgi:hypothetical protein
MPTKFKPSEKTYDRLTKSTAIKHYYMKGTAEKDLFDYINSTNAVPKRKAKCTKELQRRGIK